MGALRLGGKVGRFAWVGKWEGGEVSRMHQAARRPPPAACLNRPPPAARRLPPAISAEGGGARSFSKRSVGMGGALA
jgi:hypothetical protein